jgi:CubicO group peptidase (beta-lactamase class C family)
LSTRGEVIRVVSTMIGCIALVLAALGVAAPADPPDVGEVDRFLFASLDRAATPGMAVAITHGETVVFVRGYGRDGRGQDVTAHTPFRIASLSKSFTAASVLQLVESGRVDLDAPVQTYLPTFATADPDASRRITVRHLLNQTSGMADEGYPGITRDQPANLHDRLVGLHDARPVSAPGTEFHYFDPNYQVLAALVEAVTGRPFGEHLRRRLFDPLEMTGTAAAPTARAGVDAVPALAPGHVLVFGKPVARPELDGLLAGSGGVISTAADMARWLVMQSTGGTGVLTPGSVELMHTPPPGVAGGYAQGWQVVAPPDGPRRIEHTGVLSTYSGVQVLLPDSGYAFALLYDANATLVDTAGITTGLARLLTGRPAGEPRSTRLVAVSAPSARHSTCTTRSTQSTSTVRGRRGRRVPRATPSRSDPESRPAAVHTGTHWM